MKRVLFGIVIVVGILFGEIQSIKDVKKEYYKLQKKKERGYFKILKKEHSYGDVGDVKILYLDKKGRVRIFEMDAGSGDGYSKAEYIYESSGNMFFSYVYDAIVVGGDDGNDVCKKEVRSYYNSEGKLLNRRIDIQRCEPYISSFKYKIDNPLKVFKKN